RDRGHHSCSRDLRARQGALHDDEVPTYLRERGSAATQYRRRMERRDQDRTVPVRELPASQLRDALLRLEQQLCGEVAQRDDDARLDEVELALEIGAARLDLVGLRVAVAGRTALHDVGDVHLVAGEADAFDEAGQQLAGTADERDPLLVLLGAGALP